MPRTLDSAWMWNRARHLGITAQVLARRAGLDVGNHYERLLQLPLQELSATQLVAIADVLEVAVEELLIGDGESNHPQAVPATNTVDSTAGSAGQAAEAERSMGRLDRDELIAALLTYGDLAEQTILQVFEWTPAQLSAVIALARHASGRLGIDLRRTAGLVALTPSEQLPDRLHERLADLHTHGASLDPHETLFLTVALRARSLSLPERPSAPWHIVEALAAKGAALTPTGRPGQQVPLVPHADLLYALNLGPAPRHRKNPATARTATP